MVVITMVQKPFQPKGWGLVLIMEFLEPAIVTKAEARGDDIIILGICIKTCIPDLFSDKNHIDLVLTGEPVPDNGGFGGISRGMADNGQEGKWPGCHCEVKWAAWVPLWINTKLIIVLAMALGNHCHCKDFGMLDQGDNGKDD